MRSSGQEPVWHVPQLSLSGHPSSFVYTRDVRPLWLLFYVWNHSPPCPWPTQWLIKGGFLSECAFTDIRQQVDGWTQ